MRNYYVKLFFELDQWLWRKCHIKISIIASSGSSFDQQSTTVCAILEGVIRNNSVTLY